MTEKVVHIFSDMGDLSGQKEKIVVCKDDEKGFSFCTTCDFGTEFEVFQSLSESTAGYTWTDKVSITTQSKPIGTYRVGFQCEITETGASEEVRFMVDSVSIHNHSTGNDELEPYLEDYNWTTLSGIHYITLTSARTISLAIQFKDNGTGKMSNATIEIWRVS